jgi:hypothetical protein
MFLYRPPKGSCWGHSLGKDTAKASVKLDAFLDAYFERVDSASPTTWFVAWKDSILPKMEWAEAFQGSENRKGFLVSVSGNRVMFPMGIVFPLSTTEPTSFEFLRRFSTSVPFRMSAKHFLIGFVAKNGGFSWRKPEAEMAGNLQEAVG